MDDGLALTLLFLCSTVGVALPVLATTLAAGSLGVSWVQHRRLGELEAALRRMAPAPEVAEPEPAAEVEGERVDRGPRPTSGGGWPAFTLPSPERVAVWVASILGGFLVLLASLFALAVAFERGLLGPSTRVSLGLVAGTLLWTAGVALRARDFRLLGSALGGAGLGTVYGSLFAAASLYDLLPDLAAFAAMVAVTAVAMAGAVRHGDRFLAHLGLLGGILTPVLVSSGENNAVGLFGYLALLVAGAQVAAVRRTWPDLTAGAALGTVALYVGWTVTWHAPDQVPVALGAALVLAIPFAAATRADAPSIRVVSTLATAVVALCALPWMAPLDPVFVDPRNGLEVVRPRDGGQWWVAVAAGALPLPLLLAARRRRGSGGRDADGTGAAWPGVVTALLATAVAGLLALVAASWAAFPEPSFSALAVASVAALAAALVLAGRPSAGRGVLPLPVLAGLALATWIGAGEPPGPVAAGAVAAACVLGALLALATGVRFTLLATLAGVSVPLAILGARVEDLGAATVAAPTVLAYGLLATLPVLVARRGRASHTLTAALAAPLLFWPLYQAWSAGLGPATIGLLPLLLGASALLAAAVLLRVHRVGERDGVLALFVGVALLGVSASIPVQLERQWLTVAWALEAAALAGLARRLHHPLIRAGVLLLAAAVGARLLLNPWALGYGTAGGWPVLNWTLYTWGLPAACMLVAGRLYPARNPWERPVPAALYVLAVLLGFALVNVQVSDLFQDAGPIELGGVGVLQGMVRSLSWGAFGVVVLVAGLATGSRPVRLVGFALVLVAATKVFVVDLWSLEGFVRVGSVLGLGVCLLVAAFLFERLVLRQPARARVTP